MGRGWGARRRVVVAFLGCMLLAEVLLAFLVLAPGTGDGVEYALPLHPAIQSFQPDDTRLDECDEQGCFEQAFGNLAFRDGPKAAVVAFDAMFAESGDPGCHRIAHVIGAASLAYYGGNVARTFADGTSSCFSGYYHGVLERSLLNVKSYNPDALGAVARDLCDDVEVRVSPALAGRCVHGLGHGLMLTTGYHLPLALGVCRRLAPKDRYGCKGGVFMENLSPSAGVSSRWVRDDDPLYPCNSVRPSDKLPCYRLVTSRILRVIGLDWEETARICAGVERGWVSACFESYGRDVSGQTLRNPLEIIALCSVARPFGGEAECIDYAARDIAGNFASGRQASALCRIVRRQLRAACVHTVGATVRDFMTGAAVRKGRVPSWRPPKGYVDPRLLR